MTNSITVTSVRVTDSKKIRDINRFNFFSSQFKTDRHEYLEDFDSITFSGKGAEDIKALLKRRGESLDELLDVYIDPEKNKQPMYRYKLGDEATLGDLIKNVPVFSLITVSIFIQGDNTTITFKFVKDGDAAKGSVGSVFVRNDIDIR